LPKSSLLREAKREYREALRTWAGIPASIAACTVQRPSPLSLTLLNIHLTHYSLGKPAQLNLEATMRQHFRGATLR